MKHAKLVAQKNKNLVTQVQIKSKKKLRNNLSEKLAELKETPSPDNFVNVDSLSPSSRHKHRSQPLLVDQSQLQDIIVEEIEAEKESEEENHIDDSNDILSS